MTNMMMMKMIMLMMMFMLIRYTKYKIAFISNHVNAQQKYEKKTLHVPVAHGADATSQVASVSVARGMCSRLQTVAGTCCPKGAQGDNFAKRLEKFHFTPTRNDGENEANEASDMK